MFTLICLQLMGWIVTLASLSHTKNIKNKKPLAYTIQKLFHIERILVTYKIHLQFCFHDVFEGQAINKIVVLKCNISLLFFVYRFGLR